MKNKKLLIGGLFLFLAFINCCMFPFLNLTKENPIQINIINWLIIYISITSYYSIGKSEVKLFPNSSILFILLFNMIAIIIGLSSRFLLEFGEVSNTYNFTVTNIFLHIAVAMAICMITWFFSKKSKIESE